MAVQLQWGLEKTGTSTLEITTGLIRAATTDNVQPLAILACEQFGNTLAISPEAIRKVEHTVVPTPKPAVISFLQSTVGYSANDCASQLGKNTAGLQFLAFAAALITTMGCFESSLVIHEMLASTAKDNTLLPTARQVRELLESLEPRCSRASMIDDVYGWARLLGDCVPSKHERSARSVIEGYPDRTGIGCLVDALRQLRRIGSEDTDRITIRTGRCASWTMAFVKWCIGYPPSVVLADGTMLLEQSGSDVILEMTDTVDRFCVTVHSYINGPSELVAAHSGGDIAGMVPMRSFGDFLLRRYGFHTGLAADAFSEAIPCALQQVVQRLRCSHDPEKELLSGSDPRIRFGGSPFPEAAAISQSYHCLFGEDLDLLTSVDGLNRACMTMPLMAKYLSTMGKSCLCRDCSQSHPDGAPCKRSKVREDFAKIVASVLALSLFDRPDSLQVHILLDSRNRSNSNFHQTVMSILGTADFSVACTVGSILQLALTLVGHEASSDHPHWIMSSARGQTVWPAIYETFAFSRRGFLRLTWLPGILMHRGDVFRQAVSDPPRYLFDRHPAEIGFREVTGPINVFHDLTPTWDVNPLPAALHVVGVVKDTTREEIVGKFGVRLGLNRIAVALFMEGCGHPLDARLERPDLNAQFAGLLIPTQLQELPVSTEELGHRKISVIPVDGDDGLRFVVLCNGTRVTGLVLLRGDACLACCLETCRKTGAETIIL